MKRIAWKFAASTVALSAAGATFATGGAGIAPAAAYSQDRSPGNAAELVGRAQRAAADNKLADAVHLLEQAVSLAPLDAEARLLLADAYMKSGRFKAAQTTYSDVLEIDPSRVRAGLGLALMQVANGLQEQAMGQLERLEGSAAPADLGLAYAIAGAPKRAIELLEPAARSMGATPRVRQNLALAYAFGGDWERARIIAAQDVSPAELADRMGQWAALTSRAGPPKQVAAMLGVEPAADAGQPVQLALRGGAPAAAYMPQPIEYAAAQPVAAGPVIPPQAAPAQQAAPVVEAAPAPAPVAFAAAQPMPVAPVQAEPVMPAPVMVASAPAATAPAVDTDLAPPPPVAWAEAEPVAAPAPVPAPVVALAAAAPAEEYAELEAPEWGLDESGKIELPKEEPADREPARVQYAAAAETLVRPDTAVMRVTRRAVAPVSAVAFKAGRPTLPGTRSGSGRFVVQIGAFSSTANADGAWQTYEKKYGLRSEQPVTMTVDHQGRLLHRVAISGFVKRGDATQVCRAIQAQGGECFVRTNAGDATIDWAARYTRRA